MSFETSHEFRVEDSRYAELEENSVDLVVTSPPYPMIEMWDDMYDELYGSGTIEHFLERGDHELAFRSMHEILNAVWSNIKKCVKPGGIVCINIGDATRKTSSGFKMFSNRSKIIDFFVSHQSSVINNSQFNLLPEIVWRKPANSLNKFMGSGMIPTNAYVTHEHEYILIFRNGPKRDFEAKSDNRYESAYFWEERNRWFTDMWDGIRGVDQDLRDNEARERSGAFPLELPYRLINMFSVYEDTVLDPFAGLGTTSLASMITGRNSISIDYEPEFFEFFEEQTEMIKDVCDDFNSNRLENHREFCNNNETTYESVHYDFPVKTKQEENIKLYGIEELNQDENNFNVKHSKWS